MEIPAMSSLDQISLKESYSIQIASVHHLSDVLRIMVENFYHEETMFKSLCSNVEICDDEKKRINEFFDESIKSAFQTSPCLVAIHNDSLQVVGVNVTTLNVNPKTGNLKDRLATIFATETSIPSLAKTYIEYLVKMNDEAQLFNKYPHVETMWEFYAIAIDKNHRKLGLAKELMNAGIVLARETKVSLVFGVFTSIYSRKGAEKVGMKSVMEFDLNRYKDANGAKVFKDTEPHNIVSVMVLEI